MGKNKHPSPPIGQRPMETGQDSQTQGGDGSARGVALGPFFQMCREVVTDRFKHILHLVTAHTEETTKKVQQTYQALLGKKYQEHTLPRAVYMVRQQHSQ